MRMAVLGRRGVVGALSLALLMLPGAAGSGAALSPGMPVKYAVSAASGMPSALPGPTVTAPRVAFTDDSDRIERTDAQMSSVEQLSLGDHTGESTGEEVGPASVLVATAEDPNGEVYLDTGAGPLARVTCNSAVETHPELSPDGLRVAYSSNETGEEHIWVVWPYAGGSPSSENLLPCDQMRRVMLTKAPGRDLWPGWVDDTRLVFSSTRSDPLGDIWTIPVSAAGQADPDREARQLTAGKDAETQPEAVTVPIDDPVLTVTTTPPINVAPVVFDAGPPGRLRSDGGGPVDRRGVVFTTTQFRLDGSLGVIEFALDASGNYKMLPVHSLWPKDQDPDRPPPQSSEPDYSSSSGPFDQCLMYTTTDADPAGDVRHARLTAPFDGGFTASDRGPVAIQQGQAETHGSHYGSVSRLHGAHTIRTHTADVSDAVAADGSGRRVVASADPLEQTDERSPTYSPDGTRVAYARQTEDGGSEIVVARADGSGPMALVPGRPTKEIQQEPAWSPDGTRIAFVGQTQTLDSGSYGRRTIRVADVATGGVTALGPDLYETVYDESPSWSPDSTRLVFARRDISIAQTVLLVADARTGSSVPLEGPGVRVCDECVPHIQGRVPAWSPDGLRIAYEDRGTVRVAHLRDADGNGHPDVPEVVTSSEAVSGFFDDAGRQPTPSRPILSAATDPAWSPDGSELAVAGQPAGVPDQSGVYALRPDGTGLRTVAQDRGPETEPAWQPYGDLAVTVTSTAAQLATGESATLTATITNTGPNLAADAVLSLDADGLTPGAAPAGCSLAGPVLTCALAALAPGAAVQRSLPVVGSVARSNLVGTTVQSPTPDIQPENNAAQVTVGVADGTAVAHQSDLSVALSFGGTGFVAGSGYVGGAGQATVTVMNNGQATATGVTVTTSLPAGLTNAPSGPACLLQSVACPLPDLAPGATEVLVASFRFASVGSAPGTATVTGSTIDPVPGNNSASTVLTVKQPALVLSPDVLAPGGVTIVQGVDFPPGVDVNLLWDRGITEPLPTLGAGPDGAIAPVQVLVFRRDEIGARNLTAKAVLPDVMNAVTKELLVAPQRLAPPDFLVRS